MNCGCSENSFVIRYELEMENKIVSKDSEIALLKSNIYTDQKIAEVYERLNTKIGVVEAGINAQAVYNAANTATIGCIQGQVAQLFGLTKLVVPNTSVCPGWGNVTITPSTTTTGAQDSDYKKKEGYTIALFKFKRSIYVQFRPSYGGFNKIY